MHRNRNVFSIILTLALCLAASACSGRSDDENLLPSLGAANVVTVSGISSGGYMAGQYQVAFAKSVSGAGIVAAGPWGCAMGTIERALQDCIDGDGVDITELRKLAEEMASDNRIDALEQLEDDRYVLFRGTHDAVVGAKIVDALQQSITQIADNSNILRIADIPAAHGWPTVSYGGNCDEFSAPYIIDCDYDLAGAILSHLYTGLTPPAGETGTARRFAQRPFGDASLADDGYVYVPKRCETSTGCRVHVFFHGCGQSADTIGTSLVDNSGFNRWAEANDIVVLYPQVAKSLAAPVNPLGCWDWWGYTGTDYLSKAGPQLEAVRRMIDRLQELAVK